MGCLNSRKRQIEFRGRHIHQIEQTIKEEDLKQIESVLIKIVTNCIVSKVKYLNMNYLIAYVETKLNIHDLKQHCLAHLPFYLIPSLFIILDKINQQNLLPVDLTSLSILSNTNEQPRTEIEQRVYKIWCEILSNIDSILSISTSFFSIGDDPKLFIKLFKKYSTNFKHNLCITALLQQPTIAHHARLLFKHSDINVPFSDQYSQSIKTSEGKWKFSFIVLRVSVSVDISSLLTPTPSSYKDQLLTKKKVFY